jgi:phage terminase large subunit-like protein
MNALTPSNSSSLTLEAAEQLHGLLTKARADRRARNRLAYFNPYPKQLEFYAKGLVSRERLLMAANQVGKTFCGASEVAMHLTGRYPDWWPGRRYDRPINAWAGSDTSETTRDTVQTNLIGPPASESDWGIGAIPAECIVDTSRRMGVADALDTVTVRHISGANSFLGFKSYDQGRQKWQGTVKDVIWLDEEPPENIYTEALTRTNTVVDGMVMLTFTPLLGMSTVVHMFLDSE